MGLSRDKQIEITEKNISELVIPKVKVQKAYNYYNCIIDTEQFRCFEENYGIGNPTSVAFIPLIKKHIDALVGEHTGIPLSPSVSCKDSRTIGFAMRDKQLKIKSEIAKYYKNIFRNQIILGLNGGLDDDAVKAEMIRLRKTINESFISEYEIAAQNIIKWILQTRSIDIYNKRRQTMYDLSISGQCYYRVEKTADGHNFRIKTFNPMNVFPDKNPESNYVCDCSRIVVRRWMTRQDVLNEYGKYLNSTTISELNDIWRDGSAYANTVLVRTYAEDGRPFPVSQHIGDDVNVTPGLPEEGNHRMNYFIPVYETEWIETEKEDGVFVKNRYKTIRIGETIYITLGKDTEAIRSIDDPTNCKLSINGIFFTNRSNKPFSVVLQCAELQDKYNIVNYLRDNVIYGSGTIGDYVDLAKLPACLGSDWAERLEKLTAYKKQGHYLFDSSQDGIPVVNQAFTGYDDTIKSQTMQAFEIVIQSIERQCSSITGMFQERLDGIRQYDSVSNVQTGVRNSYNVTEWIFQQTDSLDRDMLIDMLDMAKIVYKDGIQGELILGPNLKRTFIALPEHYTMSDFDIHIPSSTKTIRDIELLKGVVGDMVKTGKYEPDVIMEAITADSVTELKANINNAYREKKKEEDLIGQLQRKNEELTNQLQQTVSQLEKANKKIEQLDEAKLENERLRIKSEMELGYYKARIDENYKKGLIDTKKSAIQAEIEQTHDGNPYNDIIRKQ